METITVSGAPYKVAIRVHPTSETNDISWTTTVSKRPMLDRIKHVDIIALRKEYDRIGYTKEFLIILGNKYLPEYPCATFIKDEEYFKNKDIRDIFIERVNESKIMELIRKK